MPLILAIDPDKRQSTQLASLVKAQLQAELVQRDNAADALTALQGRVPDLVLTTSLISLREDAVLATYLRELGTAAAHVQTVTIPLLGTATPKRAKGMLAALRREKPQPAMTDGCAPDVFAEQIRQYLATAEEQKAAAAALPSEPVEAPLETVEYEEEAPALEAAAASDFYVDAPVASELQWPAPEASLEAVPETEPVIAAPSFEPAAAFEPITDVAPVVEAIVEASPVFEEAPVAEPSLDSWDVAAAEPVVTEAAVEALAIEEAAAPDPFVADEPAGVPLSQLLQMVSEWQTPAITTPAPAVEAIEAAPESTLVETFATAEPFVDAAASLEPVVDVVAQLESLEDAPAAGDFGELVLDPVAAQALDELSRQAPAPSMHDGIPAEVPVPVVEMRSFDTLDSIASQFAVGPAPKYDDLNDIASLFAAPASRAAEPDALATPTSQTQGFESLFAGPTAAESVEAIEVPGIDPSLFAAASSPQIEIEAPVDRPFEGFSYTRDEIFARPVASAPAVAEPADEPAAALDSVVEELAAVATPLPEPEPTFTLPEPVFVAPQPEAVFVAPQPEPVSVAAPEPVFVAPEPQPVFVAAQPEPESIEPVVAAREPVVVVPEPVVPEPVVPEPVVPEPVLPEPMLAASEPESEPKPVVPEPVFDELRFEPVEFAPIAFEATPAVEAIDEISLDVDAFAMPDPPAANTEPSRFAFTIVDGFGDAWSDFDVPSTDTLAADLGVGAQPPMDPYAPQATLAAKAAPASQPAPGADAPDAAPVLDDEALSMIGDAARKLSLDAMVIEEFERGARRTPRKPKKKAHAGATPVAATPERQAKKKGPVQDEWGLFDPEQCGFAALEEEEGDRRPTRDGNTRVRVISY
jgi:hypothetical protein